MASRLTRGDLVSLAIPALANLFKCMRVISTSSFPSFCDEMVPYHFLFGWAHMYWSGLYPSAIDGRMSRRLPILAEIVGMSASIIPARRARAYFHHSEGYLRLISGRQFACYAPQLSDLVLFDGGPSGEHRRALRQGSPRSGFLVSLRQGLLPLRLGDRVVLEPYMLHCCAHQFGLDQCIPADISAFDDIRADLEGAARCWAAFLRMETQARFVMPRTSRFVAFTIPYQR